MPSPRRARAARCCRPCGPEPGALALELATAGVDSEKARAEILAVGLRYHLVTAYTSLVAVDSTRKVEAPGATIVQPVEQVQGTTRIDIGDLSFMPLGGVSRDWTGLIDASPTASVDAAGVRLSGTTGAETKYIVDGRADPQWTTIPEEIRRLERASRATTSGPRRGERVEVHARSRLRSLAGVDARHRRRFQVG